jgi:hypothetical protein
VKKLKVAVGIYGTLVFLEKFPDDEEHYGLQEMLDCCYFEFEAEEPPGVYLATMAIESRYNAFQGEHDAELYIDKLEPVV